MNRRLAWIGSPVLLAGAAAVILLVLSRAEPLAPERPRGKLAVTPAAEKPGIEPGGRGNRDGREPPGPAGEAEAPARERNPGNKMERCVRGRVVSTEDEAPIRGARIALWAGFPSSWWQTQPVRPLAAAVSDGQGRFEIPLLPNHDEIEATFVVRAAGWGTGFEEVHGLFPDVEVEITLAPGYLLTGSVVDGDDRPVASARVFVLPGDDEIETRRRDRPVPRPLPRSVTGGDGGFRLADVDLESDPEVCALDVQGFLGRAVLGDLSNAGRTVHRNIRIDRQGTLVLRLHGPTGRPVARCRCDLVRKAGEGWIDQTHDAQVEQGMLVIPALPVGRYRLLLRPAHGRPEKREAVVVAGGETRLEVEFRAGLRLAGRVRDAADRAVAGARVRAVPLKPLLAGHEIRWYGASGQDGRFLLDGLPEGPVRLRVDSDRHVPGQLTVAAGTVGLRVNLSGKPVLRGRLHVGPGDPVPQQVTLWILRDAFTARRTCEVQSDRTFRVRADYRLSNKGGEEGLCGSPPFADEQVGVVVQVEGWPPLPRKTVTICPGRDSDLGQLSRPPGRTVRGRVRGPDGQPVAGASVRLDFEDGRIRLEARTATDGGFVVPNAPPWRGTLWVDGGPDLPFVGKRLPASGEGSLSIHLPRGGRIQGRVEDPAGRPVHNATINLLHARSGGRPGRYVGFLTTVCTDREGRFRTRLLPPAVFCLSVYHDHDTLGPEIVVHDGKTSHTRIRIAPGGGGGK